LSQLTSEIDIWPADSPYIQWRRVLSVEVVELLVGRSLPLSVADEEFCRASLC